MKICAVVTSLMTLKGVMWLNSAMEELGYGRTGFRAALQSHGGTLNLQLESARLK